MGQEIKNVLLLILFISLTTGTIHGACSPHFGPAGQTECFLGTPYYSKYQWGTCLTNSYIQTFSKGELECRDPTATFCYYQCMLESHNLDEGPVYDDCACGPDAVSTTLSPKPKSTSPALPNWCYSPSGESCSWYTDCLERRHPCSASSNGYAVEYAQKFCDLYSSRQQNFSAKGQRWINAVRKCLQVKLVPILRPYVQMDCAEIKTFAFGTHTPCYLHPLPGEPSICNLNLMDWGRVFWTIKGGFVSAFSASLAGMFGVSIGCATKWIQRLVSPVPVHIIEEKGETLNQKINDVKDTVSDVKDTVSDVIDTGMRLIKLVIEESRRFICGPHCISKRSISAENTDDIANKAVEQIAKQLNWQEDGIQWFAFLRNGSSADEIDLNILLGSRAMYDVNAVDVPEADMNKTVDDLTYAIGNEQLSIDIGQDFKVTNYSACFDINCQEKYHEVIPKLKSAIIHISDASCIAPKLHFFINALIFMTLI